MSQVKGITISNSGLDIDTLVKNSVATYQNKYDAAYKKKITAEWTKTAYADIYSAVSTFRDGTAYDFRWLAATTSHAVTSGDSSVVTASANGDAINMSHDVKVNKIAKNASLQSMTSITRAASSSSATSIKLADIAGIEITDANKESEEIAISFDVQDSADSTQKHTVSYTYKDLQNKTLNNFASDIKKLGLNITASYDSANDNMSIYNNKSGIDNVIKITANTAADNTSTTVSEDTNTLLTNLNLGSYTSGTLTAVDTTALASGNIKGENASITIDGREYTSSSNVVVSNGVTYTALKESTSSTSVTISTDTEALVKSVQKFVDSYNELLDKLNTQLHATKYSAYGALTTEEEENMSDKQVEKWEEKAKSGLLKNDSIISNIVSEMRNALAQKVEGLTGNYTTAASLGIATAKSGTAWKEYGKLHLDEKKLRAAIAEDPDVVNKIFASDNTNLSTTDISTQGVSNRLYNIMKDGMENISKKAGTTASYSNDYSSTLGKQLTDMDASLKLLLRRLQDKENYYYTKYNKMESAIGSLDSSISSLTSMLG
ncbi:flagellar filament capping protein FliD [Anaerosinus massiliensis]|uniref:flagellar filament capping protein FliD n=1 Tax=Massilibacillus massiliensis TaxID=1806837 RepID=UPI000AB774C6|nr:flagellar filament capping protein FliD [Massilibacillus massiliensis]